MKACALLLLLTGCVTHNVPPCAPQSQTGIRFACSQMPVCKYNCAQTIVITEGGNAPAEVQTNNTQQRSGMHVGATDTGPIP